ncbi:hypothetical protein [Nocardioides plantarum]|uniref:EccD-like transmembrane domain-containing protein n=1 Tax=Nocardioides plantarum TaxID=29299 RepID=A0ABV5K5U2_9ACTN|nr:hypothetical protein [Nocardioides plantarum]
MSSTSRADDVLSVSVHGPVGVLDLQVPAAASSVDVAREYSRQANLPTVPALYTRLGRPLSAAVSLAEAGVVTGTVLVATTDLAPPPRRSRRDVRRRRHVLEPGALSTLWCLAAVVVAVLAGWLASRLPDGSDLREATIVVLVATAVVGVLPVGPLARHRVLAVPAYAGAAAYVVAWDPAPERFPTILGVACLIAAVTAAVARALDQPGEEGLRVWMIVGVAVFVVTTLAALADVSAQVVWAVSLVVAMLAARFVPMLAVDVPDQYLLDLERLAVTAWSARDRPTGRRGRIIVPRTVVASVAERGARTVTASCVAILVVVTVSAIMLIRETSVWIDVLGARIEVGLAGAALLLAARSYRHAAARALLRTAGLACWAVLLVVLLTAHGTGWTTVVAWVSIGSGALLVLVAVALGRGWRSAWWARRAEVAESLTGALAIGAVVVAAGLFRLLWELTG